MFLLMNSDNHRSFEDLLREYQDITIQLRKLQVFIMTKRYKLVNRISPPTMESLFILRENTNNLRKLEEISHENRKTVIYGLETITNQIPFLVVNLPNKLTTS